MRKEQTDLVATVDQVSQILSEAMKNFEKSFVQTAAKNKLKNPIAKMLSAVQKLMKHTPSVHLAALSTQIRTGSATQEALSRVLEAVKATQDDLKAEVKELQTQEDECKVFFGGGVVGEIFDLSVTLGF